MNNCCATGSCNIKNNKYGSGNDCNLCATNKCYRDTLISLLNKLILLENHYQEEIDNLQSQIDELREMHDNPSNPS